MVVRWVERLVVRWEFEKAETTVACLVAAMVGKMASGKAGN